MPELSGSTYSETDASNSAAAPNGMPEGMAPSGVNDAWRAGMGALKRFWDRINGTATLAGGTLNYTLSYTLTPGAYVTGEVFRALCNASSTGDSTLNINSLGAKHIYKPSSAGPVVLVSGDLQATEMYEFVYDAALNSAAGGFHVHGVSSSSGIYHATTSVAGTNTITATGSPVPTAYTTGDTYDFVAAATNTSATTLNVSSLGAKNIFVNLGTGIAACQGGEIVIGGTYTVVYDGTEFVLQNPTPTEGSWTPVLAGSGTAGSVTYTTQVGRYIRQGNLVFVNAHVLISAISVNPVGNMLITGLPFTASNVAGLQGAIAIGRWAGLTLTASYTQVGAEINLNTTQIQLVQSGSAQVVASVQGSGVGTTAEVVVAGVYRMG